MVEIKNNSQTKLKTEVEKYYIDNIVILNKILKKKRKEDRFYTIIHKIYFQKKINKQKKKEILKKN